MIQRLSVRMMNNTPANSLVSTCCQYLFSANAVDFLNEIRHFQASNRMTRFETILLACRESDIIRTTNYIAEI